MATKSPLLTPNMLTTPLSTGEISSRPTEENRNQEYKGLCPEGMCDVSSALIQRFPSPAWHGSPCCSAAVGGHRTPASCLTCCPMHHAGTSLLLAKYLFLHCPQASSSVAKVKISQSVPGAYETFVIMQLISPLWILLFQLDIRVTGPWG